MTNFKIIAFYMLLRERCEGILIEWFWFQISFSSKKHCSDIFIICQTAKKMWDGTTDGG